MSSINRDGRSRRSRRGAAFFRPIVLAAFALAGVVHAQAQVVPGQVVPVPPIINNSGMPDAGGLNEQMWIGVGGQSQGPISPAQIQQKIQNREITTDTQVWTKSLNRWTRAGDFPPLAQLLDAGSSGPPGPPPVDAGGPVAPTNADKLKTFLVGEWTVEAPGAYGGVTIRSIARYDSGGRYAGLVQTFISLSGEQPQLASTKPIQGTWKIQPMSESSFTLTLTGGNSGTVRLEVLDQNTLRDMDQDFTATRTGA